MTTQQLTLNLPAGQAHIISIPALCLTVKTCTLPIVVAIDGGAENPIQAGTVIDKRPNGFINLNFRNQQAVAVTVVFWLADAPVSFSPNDNSQANAQTYPLGNRGIADNAAAAGGNPACDANGYLQITAGMNWAIPATDGNGHRRQILFLSVDPAAAHNLRVLDATGKGFLNLPKAAQISLVTDGAFALSGVGGTVGVTLGEIFLLSN